MPPALAARDVRKRYGGTEALRGVDLVVEPGQAVGLVGPNGAGKSTFVKIACGLVRASGGSVEICGAPAGSAPARAALGYLPELFRLPEWATADEVLRLHQRLAGSDGGRSERARLLELVGLAPDDRRRVAAMSKGMQQRLGLAHALVGRPRLVLLDEPMSGLDPSARRTVRLLLEALRDEDVAVLLNSHLLGDVELLCDRVAILAAGRLVREGSPAQLAGGEAIEVETGRGKLRFDGAGREAVADIVAGLAARGERIYSVRRVIPTLEDLYLDAVGENTP